eukprot:640400-Prymnesium_polylepis.1
MAHLPSLTLTPSLRLTRACLNSTPTSRLHASLFSRSHPLAATSRRRLYLLLTHLASTPHPRPLASTPHPRPLASTPHPRLLVLRRSYFPYGERLAAAFRASNLSALGGDSLCGAPGAWPWERGLTFVDNHDTQRQVPFAACAPRRRGSPALSGGPSVPSARRPTALTSAPDAPSSRKLASASWLTSWLTSSTGPHWQDDGASLAHLSLRTDGRRLYEGAAAFLLAYPCGRPRLMSSFNFTSVAQGPPPTA